MHSRGHRALFLASLFLVCTFNFADRSVFAVLAQTIKPELHLTDFDLGILQGFSFALLYAVMGLPIGRLAERYSRIRILGIATLVFSGATVFCGFAANFLQMMLGRVTVGIGEAGFTPATSSLVSDHYPRERRASAMALIMLGTPAGTLLGALVGGWVAGSFGWRTAFFAMGVPGALVAVAVMLLLREPARGALDGVARSSVATVPNFSAFLAAMRAKKALFYVTLGGGLAGFGMTSISQFLAVFLARAHHLPVRGAALAFGLISAVSLTIGFLVGSYGTDYLARKDGRWPAWGSAIGLSSAPLIYWIAFRTVDTPMACVLLTLAGTLMLVFYGPTIGMIQNMLEPRMRATGTAVFAIFYTVFGAGLGPVFVGWMSDRIATASFPAGAYLTSCGHGRSAPDLAEACMQASAEGVRGALTIAVCVLFVAGCLYLIGSRYLRQDQYRPGAP